MWVFMCVALKAPRLRRRIDVIVTLESMIRGTARVWKSAGGVCLCVCQNGKVSVKRL